MTIRPLGPASGDLTRMVVLGLLERGDMHGYGIKSTLARWRMDWWADVQTGSIYAALRQLEKEGLIAIAGTAQNGRRPPQRIYRITAKGREELQRLYREAWAQPMRFARPIDVAFSLHESQSRHDIELLLQERLHNLDGFIQAFRHTPEISESVQDGIHEMITDLFEHERRLLRAERSWTQHVLERLQSGAYFGSRSSRTRTSKPRAKL